MLQPNVLLTDKPGFIPHVGDVLKNDVQTTLGSTEFYASADRIAVVSWARSANQNLESVCRTI